VQELPVQSKVRSKRTRSDRVWVNYSIPCDAKEIILKEVGPGARVCGQFIARLLYEHRAREEARREALAETAPTGSTHFIAEQTRT